MSIASTNETIKWWKNKTKQIKQTTNYVRHTQFILVNGTHYEWKKSNSKQTCIIRICYTILGSMRNKQ